MRTGRGGARCICVRGGGGGGGGQKSAIKIRTYLMDDPKARFNVGIVLDVVYY